MKKLLLFVFVALAMVSPSNCFADIASGVSGTCTWSISDDGTLTVQPKSGSEGTLGSWEKQTETPWHEYCQNIKNAVFKGKVLAKTCCGLLFSCNNMTRVDLSGLDTKNVTDMSWMFGDCWCLESLDVSKLNTSNVTNMNAMFAKCQDLETLDVSKFNTSKVTNMNKMFYELPSLQSLNVRNFDTRNVTDMGLMFALCSRIQSLDLSKFNTSKVTDMNGLVNACERLTSIDLSSFDTRNVTNMSAMFCLCESLTNIDLSKFNTSKVTNMSYMFSQCHALQSLDLSTFNTSNVTDMFCMFYKCESLTKLNLTNFVTTKADIKSLFKETNALTTIISNAKTPSKLRDDTFTLLPTLRTCKLICPSASESEYKKASGWRHLHQTTTGIEDINVSDKALPTVTFSTSGVRHTAPIKGINIINGKKVIVK